MIGFLFSLKLTIHIQKPSLFLFTKCYISDRQNRLVWPIRKNYQMSGVSVEKRLAQLQKDKARKKKAPKRKVDRCVIIRVKTRVKTSKKGKFKISSTVEFQTDRTLPLNRLTTHVTVPRTRAVMFFNCAQFKISGLTGWYPLQQATSYCFGCNNGRSLGIRSQYLL